MALTNLLAKLESEFNHTAAQLKTATGQEKFDLNERKIKIERLLHQYISIEAQYKELMRLNSIY